jgi:chorismate-pyruvate lyase
MAAKVDEGKLLKAAGERGHGYDPGVHFTHRQDLGRMSVERQIFPTDARHAPLRRMLLAQDGSTTRVCEALAGQPIEVVVHHQQRTGDVPAAVHAQLGGSAWLERVTSLVADGRVMMDNLSYTRLDVVPAWFLDKLDEGVAPVGHLLAHLFVQREAVPVDAATQDALWRHVGVRDDATSRSYRVVTAETPLMLIFEAFREGMVPRV